MYRTYKTMQCKSLTAKNKLCKNKNQKGSLYCNTHKLHDKENSISTGTPSEDEQHEQPKQSSKPKKPMKLSRNIKKVNKLNELHTHKQLSDSHISIGCDEDVDADDEISEKDFQISKMKKEIVMLKRKLNMNTYDDGINKTERETQTESQSQSQSQIDTFTKNEMSDDSMKLMMYELGDLRSEKEQKDEQNADWDKITAACNRAKFRTNYNNSNYFDHSYVIAASITLSVLGGMFMIYNRYKH